MQELPSVAQNLADLRAWRDAYAAKFNYDTAAIFRNIQRMEASRDRVTLLPPAVPSDRPCPACGCSGDGRKGEGRMRP